MPDIKIPDINTDVTKAAKDIAAVAKDATYVVIGAGVLGFQQAQVQRQELLKRLAEPKADIEGRVTAVRTDLSGALHSVDTTVDNLAERLEEIIERLEAAVAPLEDRLPTQARDVAKQAHVQAKEARTQLRSRIPTVAA
jgi:polyhydroxyalkanoate synthesis regulator phasin